MLVAEKLKSINDTQLKVFISEIDFLMQNDLNSNWSTTQIKQWNMSIIRSRCIHSSPRTI
jgi:hypothetical protein